MLTGIAQDVEEAGYTVLPRYRVGAPAEAVFSDFGVLTSVRVDRLIQYLTPKSQNEAGATSYSGMYGLARFPLHTDLAHFRKPPRYLALRCVMGFKEVSTILLDGEALVQEVGHSLLSRALVKSRRPQNGRFVLMQLLQQTGSSKLIRWDDVFLKPASISGELGMSMVREAINTLPTVSIALSEPGDTLVVDNWRMLHARSPVPLGCEGRLIERAYLETLQ